MRIKAVLKGTVTALVLTFVFMLITAAVLCFTELDESIAAAGMYIGTAAGVITGAVCTAKSAKSRVLLNCLLTGVLYLAVMAVLTLIVKGGIVFNYHFFTVAAGVIACSVFGAVVGRAGA